MAAAGVAAAARSNPSCTTTKIADDQYAGMSCEELRAEDERLLQEAVDLRPQLSPGEEQRKKDFAYISAEMDALNRVRTSKKC